MCLCSQEINTGILSTKMDSLFCINTNSFKGKYNEVINAVENDWLIFFNPITEIGVWELREF